MPGCAMIVLLGAILSTVVLSLPFAKRQDLVVFHVYLVIVCLSPIRIANANADRGVATCGVLFH